VSFKPATATIAVSSTPVVATAKSVLKIFLAAFAIS